MFDKLKQLSKETAIYGVSTMVGRFLTFLLVPLYTNIFPPAEYGIVNNLYALIAIMNIFFIYGMDAAYLKFASTDEPELGKDKFSTPYISVFLVAFTFGITLTLLRNSFGKLLDIPAEYYPLIIYVALILFFDAITSLPFIKLRIERKAKKFATFKVINIVINVCLNLILILKMKLGIEAILISNAAASFSSLVLLSPTIFKNLKLDVFSVYFKRLLKFGLPYLPAGFAVMLIQVIDVPILTYLTDFKTVGIYKASYRLGIFMMLFVNMFQYAWQPFFLQESKEKNAKEVFSKVLTYFTIIGSVILIVLSLFIDDVVKIQIFGRSIIGSAYWSGLPIVPIILLGYLFNGIYVIFTAGIYITEKSIYFPIITGLGAAVNIGANFLLIPYFGIMGAAFATFAAYFVIAIGFYLVTRKIYKINYEFLKISKLFFSIFIVGGIYYYLFYNGYLTLIYKFLLLILFSALIFFLVIEKEEIQFIKRKLARVRR